MTDNKQKELSTLTPQKRNYSTIIIFVVTILLFSGLGAYLQFGEMPVAESEFFENNSSDCFDDTIVKIDEYNNEPKSIGTNIPTSKRDTANNKAAFLRAIREIKSDPTVCSEPPWNNQGFAHELDELLKGVHSLRQNSVNICYMHPYHSYDNNFRKRFPNYGLNEPIEMDTFLFSLQDTYFCFLNGDWELMERYSKQNRKKFSNNIKVYALNIMIYHEDIRVIESIRKVLLSKMSELRNIYKKFVKTDSKIEGTYTVKICITPSGTTIRAVVIESSLGNEKLEVALLKQIKRWTYKRVENEPITVIFPLEFSIE